MRPSPGAGKPRTCALTTERRCAGCGRPLTAQRRGARHHDAKCRALATRNRRHGAFVTELGRIRQVLGELAASVDRLQAVADDLRPGRNPNKGRTA